MLNNYLKLAFRNLWNNKVFSAINVTGLSLGMAVCITILLFVRYEASFDTMHTRNIYRLDEVQSPEGMTSAQKVALSMYPMGPTLREDFPEIKNYVRLHPFEMAGLAYKDKKEFLDNVFWTDGSFFSIFNYSLLRGDPRTALERPNSVVLTVESARRLFGSEDPIGKSVRTHNRRDTLFFTVTGIMENVPENSHLQFNGLYSLSTLVDPKSENWRTGWGANWVITYLELNDQANVKALEARFPAYLKKYMGNEVTKSLTIFLQKLGDVHGDSGDITHDYHNFRKFDRSYTGVFLAIAIIVLVIGCVNFINLSTARSARRAKEVGVRKSIGAARLQLAMQFTGESVMLALIAMIISILLVKLTLPWVKGLSGHTLEFSVLHDPMLLLCLTGGALLVGILSGIYPAVYLSAFEPVKVLKGMTAQGSSRSLMRSTLVVVQFSCAAFLIIATIFVVRQLNYMRSMDAGFNKDQVIIISGAYKGYRNLKQKLLESPLVKGVTGSTQSLGNNLHQTGFHFVGNGPARDLVSSHTVVDEDFITLYQIRLLAGKNFTKAGNGKEFIVNESLARELLKDEPDKAYGSLIGKHMSYYDNTDGVIVGVTKDFNFNSLHSKIETLCLINQSEHGFHDVSVKLDARHVKEAIAYVDRTYKKNITSYPFSYVFLDDHFAKLYYNDERVGKVVSILGLLAIVIACMGLFGLASFAAETRIKEIGIRKVLGASVPAIVALLSRDFIRLVLLANIIAWPLAWYLLTAWLQNYAYRISLEWWAFVLAGVVSVVIALLSVSAQTVKAAAANPVKSLRTE